MLFKCLLDMAYFETFASSKTLNRSEKLRVGMGFVGYSILFLHGCFAADGDARPAVPGDLAQVDAASADAAPTDATSADARPNQMLIPTHLGSLRCTDSDFGAPLQITILQPWNTDTDCDAVVAQADGPEICVIKRRSITIAQTGQLVARGSRALALFAADQVQIDGSVNGSAEGAVPGPGAGTNQAMAGGRAQRVLGGGGGGGNGTAGALGAGYEFRSYPNEAGNLYPGGMQGGANPDSGFANLVGGGSGGAGGNGESGGAGGGAVALVACRQINLGSRSKIFVGGGGGPTARPGTEQCVGGGGGGAGGTIHIESPHVDIEQGAGLYANGGSGGNGAAFQRNGQWGGCLALPSGVDALNTTAAAVAGRGGSGGARGAAPTIGRTGLQVRSEISNTGGGGGGAVGRIRIDRGRDIAIDTAAIAASPTPSLGFVVMR